MYSIKKLSKSKSQSQIWNLYSLFCEGFSPKIKNSDPIFRRASIQKSILSFLENLSTVYVIEDSYTKEYVSMIVVDEVPIKHGYNYRLSSITTRKSYRNQGLVKELIFHILQNVQNGIWLEVNAENSAFTFYKKIGFTSYDVKSPEINNVIFEEGEGTPRIIMLCN